MRHRLTPFLTTLTLLVAAVLSAGGPANALPLQVSPVGTTAGGGSISGSLVAYRFSNTELRVTDTSSGHTDSIPISAQFYSISGTTVAVSDGFPNGNIHTFDLQTNTLSPALASGSGVGLDAGRIVFQADDGNDLEVYVLDLSTSNITQITDNLVDDFEPVLSGSLVAYRHDGRDGLNPSELVVFDLGSGLENTVAVGVGDIDLHGSWVAYETALGLYENNLFVENLVSGVQYAFATGDDPALSDEYAVWEGTGPCLGFVRLADGATGCQSTGGLHVRNPSVDGSLAAFFNNQGVFVLDVPEPSTALLLACGLVGLIWIRRCRAAHQARHSSSLLVWLVVALGACLAPEAIQAVTLQPGDLLVSDQGTDAIIRVDPSSGAQEVVSSGNLLASPNGIAIDSLGNIFVNDQVTDAILRVNPVTGSQAVVSSGGIIGSPSGLLGIAIDSAGEIIVTSTTSNSILRVDPVNGGQEVVSAGGNLGFPSFVTIDADGDVVLTDGVADAVLRIDPTTGAQSIISSGGRLDQPFGIAIDSGGNIVVAETVPNFGSEIPEILRIDPATGQQSTISSGGYLGNPLGLAIDDAGNIFVADDASSSIIRVDPITGVQTVISSGGSLLVPVGIAVVPQGFAIPEPTTAVLLACGLAALGWIGRRRLH